MAAILRTSQYKAIGGASAKFDSAMAVSQIYRFVANTDCWVLVGATGASAVADTANNHLYIKGQVIFLSAHDAANGFVHMIQDSEAGDATLSLVEGTGI